MSAWTCLALWWAMAAHGKSVLVVAFDRPVVVVVNMKPYTPSGDQVVVEFPDGREGTQNVRIRNLLGQQQWAGRVDVPEGHKVKARWELQNMTVGDPEPLERKEAPRKLTDEGYEIVDGKLVKLKPGEQDAASRPEPKPAPSPRTPTEDPFLTVVEEVADGGGEAATAPRPAPAAPGATDETPASTREAGSPGAALPPGVGEVWFHNRNSTWTNVHVDGTLHEVRQQEGFRLQLPPGEHEVRIADFRDKEVWWEGRVVVGEGQRLELQFSRSTPPRVMSHPDAWVEAE